MAFDSPNSQLSLTGFCQIEAAVASMAMASAESRGAVFTRREVVEFILDLTGYTADKPLHRLRLLEPSMGQGDFLIPVVNRLLTAYTHETDGLGDVVGDLAGCVRAVELNRASYEITRKAVGATLETFGLTRNEANRLCDDWLVLGDFLLTPLAGTFTHVIGNPPYVRQEMIPDALMAEYRRRYATIYDRADIYVPFIERSLSLLAPKGALGFICADRWMKNRYGGPLRRFIADNFHLRHFVDMVETEAFLSDVIAYPAIIVIGREKPGITRVARRPVIETNQLQALAKSMTATRLAKGLGVSDLIGVADRAEPWMLDAPDHLTVVRRIEADYPTLEEAGCKVGIGVATGADHAFIGPFEQLDVEPDRKLPLAMTKDIKTGTVAWRGLGVINPFGPDGKLVPLKAYPKMAAHFEKHGAAIKARHTAKKNPSGWYRTIDRIYPELVSVPKLLIPDIKGEAHIVYEPGNLYPHHNLYFVTADAWDLRALQAVMLSDVTRIFIGLYSTKMRGGYLRFQAQYLRRLRVPHWRDVPNSLRAELVHAAKARDFGACNEAVAKLYDLTPLERQALVLHPEDAHAA